MGLPSSKGLGEREAKAEGERVREQEQLGEEGVNKKRVVTSVKCC